MEDVIVEPVMKKNREGSSTRLSLEIGESPQVPASAAWPCATVLVRNTRKSHTTKLRSTVDS